MPVPQNFVIVEEQARCLFHKILLLWKNRQDACSTKFCYCGRTGKMPVPQNFVIVEEQARCLFHKILLLWKNRQDA
ncbi:hypothetical protein QUA08_32395, partial [Microcoleus sp. T3B2]